MVAWVPRPSRRVQRVLAALTVIAWCGVAVTETGVRLGRSGLRCAAWPDCASGTLVPVTGSALGRAHRWIEFGHQFLSVGLVAVSILVFAAALSSRPWRRRHVLLAAVMPAGVVVWALTEWVMVHTGLAWWSVGLNFLVSPLLLWPSVLLFRSVDEGDGPARSVVSAPLRRLLLVESGTVAAVLLAGAFVTAAGPHAGNSARSRLLAPIPALVGVHAMLVLLLVALFIGIGLWGDEDLRRLHTLRVRYRALAGLLAANAVLGLIQYARGVPAAMIPFHALGAVLIAAGAVSLWCASRERAVPSRASSDPD